MYKVAVVGGITSSNVLIKAKLLETKMYEVELVDNIKQLMLLLKADCIDLGIFNLETVEPKHVKVFNNMRQIGIKVPILVLGHCQPYEILSGLEEGHTVALLTKPYVDKDLLYLTQELSERNQVRHRIHHRYVTNMPVRLSLAPLHDFTLEAHLKNISQGGALIHFSGSHLQKEDSVELDFHLEEMGKRYFIPAEVVWTKKDGRKANKWWAGVHFTSFEPGLLNIQALVEQVNTKKKETKDKSKSV